MSQQNSEPFPCLCGVPSSEEMLLPLAQSVKEGLRVRGRDKRMVSLAALLFLLSLLLTGWWAHAQTGTNNANAKDTQAVFDTLDDLDRLHVLNPLKLTPEQIDKIVEALATEQKDYDARQVALNAPVIALATEIRTTKRKALAGEAIPQDFDDKINKLRVSYNAKQIAINQQTLADLTAKVKPILTEKQIGVITKLEKDAYAKQGRTAKGDADQWLAQYVLDEFINAPHPAALLKEMRTGASTAGAAAGDSSKATGDNSGK